MPVGGVVQQILVKDGQEVQAEVLIKLDTETSKEQKTSYETQLKAIDETLALKQQELKLEFGA